MKSATEELSPLEHHFSVFLSSRFISIDYKEKKGLLLDARALDPYFEVRQNGISPNRLALSLQRQGSTKGDPRSVGESTQSRFPDISEVRQAPGRKNRSIQSSIQPHSRSGRERTAVPRLLFPGRAAPCDPSFLDDLASPAEGQRAGGH
ncbi:MAG: hypothetical protein ACP5FH_02020, partial [Terracidiphilus sp.]